MSELESTMWVAVGTEPGGSSSSPVITTRTVGRRITGTVAKAHGRQGPHVLGAEDAPDGQQTLPGLDVLADLADMAAGRHRVGDGHVATARTLDLACHLGHDDRIGALGQGSARHDAHRLPTL